MTGMTRRELAIAAAAAAAAFFGKAQNLEDDVVLRAMRDELERSRELRVVAGGEDAPYFISYTLDDTDNLHVTASLGAVLSAGHDRVRVPNVEVRIGSYDFDNTGHIFSGYYSGSRYDSDWPLDDNYATIREALWLATDRAYKTALESMSRKRAALSSINAPAEKLADFSKADAVKSIAKLQRTKIDDAAWISRIVKLSSIFNSYKEVLSSNVELEAIGGTTYLMNSEGSAIRYPDNIYTVYAKASGQASDGMLLHDAVSFPALELDQLASEADMRKAIITVADNIRALTNAPAGEAFTGPVLFEPQAAAQLMGQLLGDNLRLPRKPLAEPGRNVNFVSSELETKTGSRVLPDFLDVVDDPSQMDWKGKPLVGYYPFDLEGVAGKTVTVVDKGILKSFLTTRQPVKGSTSSNGHARLSGAYGAHSAAISNLFVNAKESSPLADLRKKMMDMCHERDKPYGMLVRKLDYPFSGGGNELQSLASSGQQSGGSARPVSPPLLLYRVYPDGREELVRGLRFRGISTRSLRDIVAASQETALFDFVNNAAPLALVGAGGYLAPAAVVAPGLLFDELEFELPQDQLPKPPAVPPPNSGAA